MIILIQEFSLPAFFIIFSLFFYRDGLISVDDAVEAVSGYVDDLWKLGDLVYAEERMKSFLDVIGDEVVSLVRNTIDEVKKL